MDPPDLLVTIVANLLTNAVTVLADRHDQARAQEIANLQQDLQSPQSRLQAGLVKCSRRTRTSPELRDQLKSVSVDPIHAQTVADALFSKSAMSDVA